MTRFSSKRRSDLIASGRPISIVPKDLYGNFERGSNSWTTKANTCILDDQDFRRDPCMNSIGSIALYNLLTIG